MFLVLLFLHVAANLVWIGSAAAVGWILTSPQGSLTDRGGIARRIYLGLATPAFGLSLLAGAGLLAQNITGYLVASHFMHAKLLFAAAVIAFHHLLGGAAKKMAQGKPVDSAPILWFSRGLLVFAASAAYVVVAKPF